MTSWTFFNDAWHEGNPMIMGPMTHAPWLGSCVFDGARAFEGVAPDLDLHCQRLVNSARAFGLK
ncbi:MAG: branched chain amino acid aminotransferase, partial [Hyphomicrobiales bacterium]